MAKSELGTKRIDPETGRKFYDLGKDPIVSPYTGKIYPLSYFVTVGSSKVLADPEEVEEREVDAEEETAEVVPLEEADEDAKGAEDLPDIDGEDDVDLGEDDETVFLEEEEEDEDDVADIIGVGDDEEH